MFISLFKKIRKETKEELPSGTNIPNTKRKFILLTVIFLIVIIGFGGMAYYFWREASKIKQNPQKTAQEETTKTIEEVGKLMVLPEDEKPTIATVTDPERLRDQPFFAKAKVGDKVLIYTNAKKAILYDPVQHKIIEVAPLNIGSQQ